jgi:hypothetical protein
VNASNSLPNSPTSHEEEEGWTAWTAAVQPARASAAGQRQMASWPVSRCPLALASPLSPPRRAFSRPALVSWQEGARALSAWATGGEEGACVSGQHVCRIRTAVKVRYHGENRVSGFSRGVHGTDLRPDYRLLPAGARSAVAPVSGRQSLQYSRTTVLTSHKLVQKSAVLLLARYK